MIPTPAEQMSEKDTTPYSLEPDDDPAADDAPAPAARRRARIGDAFEAPLGEFEACPQCGAPMTSADEIVCLRCGFDLARNTSIRTETGVEEVVPEAEPDRPRPALSRPGRGDLVAPAIVAGVCLLVMTIGYLAGASSLYRAGTDTSRLGGLLIYYLTTAGWLGCGGIGLLIAARLHHRPLGDAHLLLVRMLGIVAAVSLVRLVIDIDSAWEFVVEFPLEAIAFVLLVQWFFGLNLEEIKTMAIVAATIPVVMFFITTLARWIF